LKYILRTIGSALSLAKKFPAIFAELVSWSILYFQSILRRCFLECPSFLAPDFTGRMDLILILLYDYSTRIKFVLRIVMMPPSAEVANSPQDQLPIEGWCKLSGSAEMKSFPRQGKSALLKVLHSGCFEVDVKLKYCAKRTEVQLGEKGGSHGPKVV
jgi:hypothetical protein